MLHTAADVDGLNLNIYFSLFFLSFRCIFFAVF